MVVQSFASRHALCAQVEVTLRIMNQVNCGEIKHFCFPLFLVFLHKEYTKNMNSSDHTCKQTLYKKVQQGYLEDFHSFFHLFLVFGGFLSGGVSHHQVSCRWTLILKHKTDSYNHRLFMSSKSTFLRLFLVLASESESLSFFSSSSLPRKNLRPATRI